jgi:1-acyl-sn-glycerol-3-phosphate acyltransferase
MIDQLRRCKEILISILAWTTGLCAFVPVGLMVVLAGMIVHPRRFDRFTKIGCRNIMRSLFVRIVVEGREHFKSDRTYLFVCNHVNIFDVFVLYGFIPNYFRGVELDEHFDWFFYGRVIRRLGMIPISQTDARSALKSLRIAEQAVGEGTSILVLPEGGRTLDGNFQPFKPGAFVLARRAGVDIVPLVMIGAFQIKRKGSLFIRPGRMTLRFGPPIAYAQIKDLQVKQISQLVRARMLSMFNA